MYCTCYMQEPPGGSTSLLESLSHFVPFSGRSGTALGTGQSHSSSCGRTTDSSNPLDTTPAILVHRVSHKLSLSLDTPVNYCYYRFLCDNHKLSNPLDTTPKRFTLRTTNSVILWILQYTTFLPSCGALYLLYWSVMETEEWARRI